MALSPVYLAAVSSSAMSSFVLGNNTVVSSLRPLPLPIEIPRRRGKIQHDRGCWT